MKLHPAQIIFFAALIYFQCCTARTEQPDHIAYVEHFLKLYPRRLEQALEHMPTLEKHCLERGIDPLTAVVVASLESAFKKTATGNAGERGWFQIMPKSVCSRGFDLDTVDGQIAAGVNCLAMARDACDGTLEQTLTMYASGSCTPRTKHTRALIRRRVGVIRKWSE